MSTRAQLQQGLVNWVSRLASPIYPAPLPEGVVVWYNRMMPYMSDDLQVGIYLRILSVKNTNPGVLWHDTAPGIVRPEYYSTRTLRLQIQSKSLADTDDEGALTWLDRIDSLLWSDDSREFLLSFDCSVIEPTQIATLEGVLDDRAASVGNYEVLLHWRSSVLGLSSGRIEHVTGTGDVDTSEAIEIQV